MTDNMIRTQVSLDRELYERRRRLPAARDLIGSCAAELNEAVSQVQRRPMDVLWAFWTAGAMTAASWNEIVYVGNPLDEQRVLLDTGPSSRR